MDKPYRKIKILLADDHEFFRDGFNFFIKDLPDIELVDSAADGEQLLKMADKYMPDVILTDIRMPGISGIEATKIITAKHPQIGVIALSMSNDENLIMDMIEAGAKGYVIKNAHKHEIPAAIRTVAKHDFYYCEATSQKFAQLIAHRFVDPKNPVKIKFSEKEIEIIRLICKEYSNKEISMQLKINVRTIEGFRKRVIKKVNARNSIGLAIYAMRYNIFVND